MSVLRSEPAPDGFDARRDARSRTYRYRVLAREEPSALERERALWWRRPLDRVAAAPAPRRSPARTTSPPSPRPRPSTCASSATSPAPNGSRSRGSVLAFWIEADTFMRHMVRILVGTMLAVSVGAADAEHFARLLTGTAARRGGRDRPAHGLYLERRRATESTILEGR